MSAQWALTRASSTDVQPENRVSGETATATQAPIAVGPKNWAAVDALETKVARADRRQETDGGLASCSITRQISENVGFGFPILRQFPQSQRFSGPDAALQMPSNGDVLVMLLRGKQPGSAPEIGFFSGAC
jgi:hypothetical protein